MTLTRVDQLLRTEAIARSRLDEALVVQHCSIGNTTLLREALLAGLPAALDVEIADCVRWRAKVRASSSGGGANVAFTLVPLFEWVPVADATRASLNIVAEVILRTDESDVDWDDAAGELFFLPTTAWSASIRLGVSCPDSDPAAHWFHERERIVHLTPWVGVEAGADRSK